MVNERKSAIRHMVIKIAKHQRQHQVLKAAREETQITHQRTNLD